MFPKLNGMTRQTSAAQAKFAAKKKTTRREQFLARLEELIPWTKLLAVIEPFYPKGERGHPPIGLERLVRIYFLQQWSGLADAWETGRPGFNPDDPSDGLRDEAGDGMSNAAECFAGTVRLTLRAT